MHILIICNVRSIGRDHSIILKYWEEHFSTIHMKLEVFFLLAQMGAYQ